MRFIYSVIVTLFYLFLSVYGQDNSDCPCKTPNGEKGVCISLFSCRVLLKSLGTLQDSAINFVKNSVCCDRPPEDLRVCCGTQGNYLGLEDATPTATAESALVDNSTRISITQDIKVEIHKDYDKKQLLPSRKYCGLQHTDDRFYTGNITALDEFPWLVHVIFLDDADEDIFQYLDRCNGVLINRRYVLTNGNCANQAPAVRLGQHNVNKTISCIVNPELPECTEPKYDVMVEQEIHRAKDNQVVQHDFALLRLSKNVQYSDFVRPICLPLPEYKRPEEIESLVFSGWGATNQETAAIKKRLIYNLTEGIDECLRIDDTNLKDFTTNNSVMCLIPDEENTELACGGDEGGPLMFSYRHQWFAEGILTSVYDWYQEKKVTGVYEEDTDMCSNRLPVSGIRITSEVLDWIMDNIRP